MKNCVPVAHNRHELASASDRFRLSENPLENRIDMFGMIGKVEFFAQLFFRKRRGDFLIGQQFGQEVFVLLPNLHSIALDQTIAVLSGHSCLCERE